MKFRVNLSFDNHANPIEFQGHWSNVKVMERDFQIFTIAR